MSDILSQNEIDDILKQLLSDGADGTIDQQGDASDKKIRVFDFKRPSKFAKDQLKTLNIIHDNYSRLSTNFLTAYLRTLVQIDVIAIDALPYGDFSNSLTNPDVMAIIDFSPLTGSIVYEMSPQIAFCFVDRILGGRGDVMTEIREFTEIELALLERTITQLLNIYKMSWENVISVNPKLEKIESNPQFAQLVSPNEIVALVTLSAKVGNVEGMMNLCIPHMVVEPIMSKLTTRFWYSLAEKEPIANSKEMLEKRLQSTYVPVKGILGKLNISVGELLELQIGDVLAIERGVDDEVDVLVGDILKFKARPGVMGKKGALKITQILKKEDE